MAVESFKELINNIKLNKFRRKCGAEKFYSLEDVNDCILEYLKKMAIRNKKVKNIELSQDQLSNRVFMNKLYQINRDIVIEPKFMPSGDNANDDDYMLWYFNNATKYFPSRLIEISSKYSYLFENDKFVARFSKEVHNANLFQILDFIDTSKNHERVKRLPIGIMMEQTRKHGNKALQYVPVNHKYFRSFVNSGIEKDGFESLKCLPLNEVAGNKELVIKAYAMSGFDALETYLKDTLNPFQATIYNFNGKKYIKREYDKERYAVQKALLKDPEIKNILEREKLRKLREMKESSNECVDHKTNDTSELEK